MIENLRQDFYELLEGTWGGDISNVLAEEESDRFNWIKYIQGGGTDVTVPFAVCIWGAMNKSPRGASTEQVWDVPLTVVLVDNADKTAEDRDIYFATMLEGLWTALQGYTGTEFAAWTQPVYDTNPLNQANRALVEQNLPYICAMASFTLNAGTSP